MSTRKAAIRKGRPGMARRPAHSPLTATVKAPPGKLADPAALTIDQLGQVLKTTAAQVRKDLAAGAPRRPDGRISLVEYVAWLLAELAKPDA